LAAIIGVATPYLSGEMGLWSALKGGLRPMIFFKRIFDKPNVWQWLVCNVQPSALAFVVTINTALSRTPMPHEHGAWVKLNDLIFMGLAISMSNLNVWRMRVSKEMKYEAAFWAMPGLLVFGFILGVARATPNVPVPSTIFAMVLLWQVIRVNLSISRRIRTQSTIKPKSK
jgi:hypothetical protein